MKLLFFVSAIFFFCTSALIAQGNDSIIVSKTKRQIPVYTQNNKVIDYKELSEILKTYPESKREVRISESLGTALVACAIPGIIMFVCTVPIRGAWEAVAAASNNPDKVKKYEDVIAVTGIGLLLISYFLYKGSEKHLGKSIYYYNRHAQIIKNTTADISVGFSVKGAGLFIRF
jgi:hypothetical protein